MRTIGIGLSGAAVMIALAMAGCCSPGVLARDSCMACGGPPIGPGMHRPLLPRHPHPRVLSRLAERHASSAIDDGPSPPGKFHPVPTRPALAPYSVPLAVPVPRQPAPAPITPEELPPALVPPARLQDSFPTSDQTARQDASRLKTGEKAPEVQAASHEQPSNSSSSSKAVGGLKWRPARPRPLRDARPSSDAP